jgi:hypothetical protein
MEAIRSSETLVITYKTTRRHNPKDDNRHLDSADNLKYEVLTQELDGDFSSGYKYFLVRIQVVTAASMKITYGLLRRVVTHHPNDVGSKHL